MSCIWSCPSGSSCTAGIHRAIGNLCTSSPAHPNSAYDALLPDELGGVWENDGRRASHNKPWRDSDNQERLDVFNGMLGPAYDAAFDAGRIGFGNDGTILISLLSPATQLMVAGISSTALISKLADQHRAYLAHHRNNVFEVGAP